MIKLTRLGGNEFVVNAELIKTVEATPDTVVSLTGGEKLLVKESVDDVVRRAIVYKRQCRMVPE